MNYDDNLTYDYDKERRKFKRIHKTFILRYHEIERPDNIHAITQLKNISLGGMCFAAMEPIEKKTRLGIQLKTPYVSHDTYFEGVVLASHEKVPNKLYEIRMEFDEGLEDEARNLLEKFIQFFLKTWETEDEDY